MTEDRSDLQDAIGAVHEDVPHRFQVSLTMSMDVRDDVRAVRDELKDRTGNGDVTTDDVMRLALIAATQCHGLVTEGSVDSETLDREQLAAVASLFDQVTETDATLAASGPSSAEDG